MDPSGWDDTLILEMFNTAIETHVKSNTSKTCGGGKKRKGCYATSGGSQHLRQGIPGTWQEVSVPLEGVHDSVEDESRDHSSKRLPIQSDSDPQSDALFFQGFQSSTSAQNTEASSVPMPVLVESALQDMLQAYFNCGVATGRYQTLVDMNSRK